MYVFVYTHIHTHTSLSGVLHVGVVADEAQKRAADFFWSWSYRRVVSSHRRQELNSDPLQKQYSLLTMEPVPHMYPILLVHLCKSVVGVN